MSCHGCRSSSVSVSGEHHDSLRVESTSARRCSEAPISRQPQQARRILFRHPVELLPGKPLGAHRQQKRGVAVRR
jgi:hypothetical protein